MDKQKQKTNKERILIAITTNRSVVPTFFMQSMIELMYATKKVYPNTEIVTLGATDISSMRNFACKMAVLKKFDYLYMVDDDMQYPNDSIIKLMKHKKPIVVGAANTRIPPYPPTQFKKVMLKGINTTENRVQALGEDLIKIEATGLCGALIKTNIFKKLKYPYFYMKYHDDMGITGEDIIFCNQLKKTKIPIYLDPTIIYGHLAKGFVVSQTGTKMLQC